jgi:hypothetical protein
MLKYHSSLLVFLCCSAASAQDEKKESKADTKLADLIVLDKNPLENLRNSNTVVT